MFIITVPVFLLGAAVRVAVNSARPVTRMRIALRLTGPVMAEGGAAPAPSARDHLQVPGPLTEVTRLTSLPGCVRRAVILRQSRPCYSSCWHLPFLSLRRGTGNESCHLSGGKNRPCCPLHTSGRLALTLFVRCQFHWPLSAHTDLSLTLLAPHSQSSVSVRPIMAPTASSSGTA